MIAPHSAISHTTPSGGVLTWLAAGNPDAPALVLLHGIGSDAMLWQKQIAVFAPHMHVLAWNAPGYAGSSPLSEDVLPGNPDVWADQLAQGLDAFGVSRCVLVGHSLGAITAARFAVTSPERVATLVLSSPARGYGQERGSDLLPALQARIDDIRQLGSAGMASRRAPRTLAPGASTEMLAEAEAAMARVSVAGYCDAVHLLACGRLAEDLIRWNGPLHLIGAAEDVIVPVKIVQELAKTFPQARLHVIEGAGHASYLQAPEQFQAALTDALSV
ncbi:MAG: alpha/beta hydrolase [Acetobacter sp.]|uniref:alpha/beta fold hydrolase n=1 Tax=Acetobacter sp. TaxID=440 RepID=UPI0039EB247D